jgi:hypothetical protein
MPPKFDDGLNVLVHGNLSKLQTLMSRQFPCQLAAVSDDMTEEPKTIGDLNDHISRGGFTHVVIPDENFHGLDGNYGDCVVPIVTLLGDHWVPWAVDRKRKYLTDNGIRHAFVFSGRFLEPFASVANFHVVLPGYDSSIFRDENRERDIDVLIHGSLGEDTDASAYPVRNWLARILPEIGEQEGIKVVPHAHPGYFPDNPLRHIREYAGMFNRSRIAIGGSGLWRTIFKKFYEGPGSGAILLSDLPQDDTAFFRGRTLEVDRSKINSAGYSDEVRRMVMDTLTGYDSARSILQPFRTEQDRFDRSYDGRALEMRLILKRIRK